MSHVPWKRVLAFTTVLVIFVPLTWAQDAPSPPFPQFFKSFLVNIEANMLQYNRTYNIREFYDADAMMARFEQYTAANTTIQLEDWRNEITYKITNNSACESSPLNSGTSFLPFGFRSSTEFFTQGAGSNAKYEGVRAVRGVPCDVWTATMVYDRNMTRSGVTARLRSTVSYEFFFTVYDWQFRDRGIHQKPVQIHMNGSRINLDTNQIHAFDHYYGFFNYVPYTPEPQLFQPPNFCLGIADRARNIARTEPVIALATLVAGLFVGLFLMGIATCILVHKYRKLQNAGSFQRHTDEL